MKRTSINFVLLALTMALTVFPAGAPAAGLQTSWAPGEVLVKMKGATDLAQTRSLFDDKGLDVVADMPILRMNLLKGEKGMDVMAECERLSQLPEVEYAQPNYYKKAFEDPFTGTPNDPRYSQQWWIDAVELPEAWERTTGSSSIRVAVLDTGCDFTHPELAANLNMISYDFVNEDNDPMDDHGHGTSTSGVIGAIGNNAEGIAGATWSIDLLALKVCQANRNCSVSHEIEGLEFAIQNNVRVLNMSFGGGYGGAAEQDAIEAAYDAGILMFAAVGNGNTSEDNYPAAFDEVIGVSAVYQSTGDTYRLSSFSNWGDQVSMTAPGSDIMTTVPTYSNSLVNPPATDYASVDGTSYSSPIAAGVAALVLSADPSMTHDELRDLLETTANQLTVVGRTGKSGETISITDAYGHGMVSAAGALRAIESEISLYGNPIFPRSVHVSMTSRLGYTSAPTVQYELVGGSGPGNLAVFAVGSSGTYAGLFHADESGDWRVTLDANVHNIGNVVRSEEVSVQ